MVATRIYEWAKSQPEKAALIQNGKTLDYAVLARSIEASRKFFEREALPVGGVAVVWIDHLADAWIAILGLRMRGVSTICIGAETDIESLQIKNLRGLACFVVSEVERPDPRFAANALPGVKTIVMPATLYADVGSGDIPDSNQDRAPFGGHILYTSGTTGTYKKLFFKGELEDRRNARRADLQWYDEKTVHNGGDFGLWTALGFKQPAAVWHAGGAVVLDQRADRAAHFFHHGVNAAFVPPFGIRVLLAERREPHAPIDQVNLAISGGFVSINLLEEVVAKLSNRVRIVYGSTELESSLRILYAGDGDIYWLNPVGETVAEIVDESGEACGPDVPGALRIQLSDLDADGYLDDEQATARAFRDGYFYTGDLAVRRGDGRVRILGRTGDVLNLRGTKIAVTPLEEQIEQRLRVANVCLFGGLNERGVEELVVAIEAERVARTEIEQMLKQFPQLGQFDEVRVCVMREFPRTRAGMHKINRKELSDRVRGERSRGA